MPGSSSDLRSFEGVFRLLLMLFDGGMLAELSGQQLKILMAVAVYQAIEDRRQWQTTVTGLEQLLGVSNKTVKRSLKDLVDRHLLVVERRKKGGYRSAKPLLLSIDPTVDRRCDWPDLSWAEVNRLTESTFDWLNDKYAPSLDLTAGFVLGLGKRPD